MERIDYDNLKQEDFIKEQKNRDIIFGRIVDFISDKPFDDEEVQVEILNLYNWMNKFYDCSISMFRGLAEVYSFNETFSEPLIRLYGKEMPNYLSKAIESFCNKSSQN